MLSLLSSLPPLLNSTTRLTGPPAMTGFRPTDTKLPSHLVAHLTHWFILFLAAFFPPTTTPPKSAATAARSVARVPADGPSDTPPTRHVVNETSADTGTWMALWVTQFHVLTSRWHEQLEPAQLPPVPAWWDVRELLLARPVSRWSSRLSLVYGAMCDVAVVLFFVTSVISLLVLSVALVWLAFAAGEWLFAWAAGMPPAAHGSLIIDPALPATATARARARAAPAEGPFWTRPLVRRRYRWTTLAWIVFLTEGAIMWHRARRGGRTVTGDGRMPGAWVGQQLEVARVDSPAARRKEKRARRVSRVEQGEGLRGEKLRWLTGFRRDRRLGARWCPRRRTRSRR